MKVDFFLSQTAQFDKSIDLFSLVFLKLEFSFAVYFQQLTQYVPIVTYNQENYFLTTNFIGFDFNALSDLNFNPNNLVVIFFIKVFLVDCLMCLNILLIVLKISKSSLSGSIHIN